MKIQLSQFIAYSSQTTTNGKVAVLHDAKYGSYAPWADYWKPIRDGLHKVLAENLNFDYLEQIALQASSNKSKQDNYLIAAKKLTQFFSKRVDQFMPPVKASWENQAHTLLVNSSPEFMLKSPDGKVLMVKVNYRLKKTAERLTKWNIPATLKMMADSTYAERPLNSEPAILNLQNGRLYTMADLRMPDDKRLEIEAAMLISIWEQI